MTHTICVRVCCRLHCILVPALCPSTSSVEQVRAVALGVRGRGGLYTNENGLCSLWIHHTFHTREGVPSLLVTPRMGAVSACMAPATPSPVLLQVAVRCAGPPPWLFQLTTKPESGQVAPCIDKEYVRFVSMRPASPLYTYALSGAGPYCFLPATWTRRKRLSLHLHLTIRRWPVCMACGSKGGPGRSHAGYGRRPKSSKQHSTAAHA